MLGTLGQQRQKHEMQLAGAEEPPSPARAGPFGDVVAVESPVVVVVKVASHTLSYVVLRILTNCKPSPPLPGSYASPMDFGTYDPAPLRDELDAAAGNLQVGTRMLLENDRVRVWEIDLGPGERAAFHTHRHPYFFVCVEAGRSRSRFPDGNEVTTDNAVGDTWFDDLTEGPQVHDLENVGTTRLRFTTVELLSG